MRKKGFTLVELLVYIVIATIVVGLAGQALLEATKLRLRTTRLLETSANTSDIMAYLGEDFARMGLKSWMPATATPTVQTDENVYWSSSSGVIVDESSFQTTPGTIGSPSRVDNVQFRTTTFNGNVRTGWEQLEFYVDAGQLLRKSIKYDLLNSSSSSITVMADSVVAFTAQFGVLESNEPPIVNVTMKADCGSANVGTGGCLVDDGSSTAATISTTLVPAIISALPSGSLVRLALSDVSSKIPIDFVEGSTYRVFFSLSSNDSAATHFLADKDYLALAIMNSAGTADLHTAQFYSAADAAFYERTFDFSPAVNISDAYLQFRFQMRSGLVAGTGMGAATFTVASVRVEELTTAKMDWKNSFTVAETDLKAKVKSVKLTVAVRVRGAVTTLSKTVFTPNNGV